VIGVSDHLIVARAECRALLARRERRRCQSSPKAAGTLERFIPNPSCGSWTNAWEAMRYWRLSNSSLNHQLRELPDDGVQISNVRVESVLLHGFGHYLEVLMELKVAADELDPRHSQLFGR
jgi:hypothetical protein